MQNPKKVGSNQSVGPDTLRGAPRGWRERCRGECNREADSTTSPVCDPLCSGLGQELGLKSSLPSTCGRHSAPFVARKTAAGPPRARKSGAAPGPPLRGGDAQRPGCQPRSGPRAERARSPWTLASHLPAPGTRARPQLCSPRPAVPVAARPFPATWPHSALGRRGADSRAYLRGLRRRVGRGTGQPRLSARAARAAAPHSSSAAGACPPGVPGPP